MLDAGKPLQLIDARPKHSVSRTQDIAVGATWRDPERVQEWMGELSKTEPVVVYCVYGFHVGCRTAIALREAGYDARYMKAAIRLESGRRSGQDAGLRRSGRSAKLAAFRKARAAMADLKVWNLRQPAQGVAQHGRPAGVPRAAATGHDAADHEHRGPPHVQPGRVRRRHARAGEAPARRDHRRRRPAACRPRIQLLGLGAAQERDRLGLARPDVFQDKPVAMFSCCTGAARRRARAVRPAQDPVQQLWAYPLRPEVFIGSAPAKFADGKLTDETTRKFLTELLARFKDWIARMQKK